MTCESKHGGQGLANQFFFWFFFCVHLKASNVISKIYNLLNSPKLQLSVKANITATTCHASVKSYLITILVSCIFQLMQESKVA